MANRTTKGESMPLKNSIHPTPAELEILSILWRTGPGTVRQVHEILGADRDTGMTTTLKILQLMVEKGLATRSDSRPQIYNAAIPQSTTQAGLLKELVRKAFDGSVQKLMVRAVEDGGLSGDELKEIRKLIDTLGRKERGAK